MRLPNFIIKFSLVFLVASVCFGQNSNFKFNFGAKAKAGFTLIQPTTIYSAENKFGFEQGAEISQQQTGSNSAKAFYFSVALPEGNYKITVTLGAESQATNTTIKAELRRLMLENIQTKKGQFVTRSFTVNVRTPNIASGGLVKLKDREKTAEWWAWDEKLTLEFNGETPSISTLEIVPVNVPTIYLLGDSTVCDQPREPYASWGQMLTRFFDDRVSIANHAESGESIKSSLGAHRFDKVLGLIKPGDYLFLQFGHNDQKEKGEGRGAFTSYKNDLEKLVAASRKKGATVVLVTSMQRRTFDEQGKITNSLGDYPAAVRQVAQEQKLALIDLHAMSKQFYEALGKENSALAFKEGDGTHHNNYGSYELAKCIVEGIRTNKLPLAKLIVKEWRSFDPAQPDAIEKIKIPPSLLSTDVKPLGN